MLAEVAFEASTRVAETRSHTKKSILAIPLRGGLVWFQDSVIILSKTMQSVACSCEDYSTAANCVWLQGHWQTVYIVNDIVQ